MATKQNTATPIAPSTASVVMTKDKDCKGSVRFFTPDAQAAVTNAYVSRTMPGISAAQSIKVTIEIVS